ncbi:DUF5994 family protein [Pseudonocardia benzenivorans]|uniref:DUF5994 family protein n=1 Tax=Pseudonocardia benzenivorans TaxID=228005 RepID=A0ABW3VLD1_9PSEU
MAIWPTSPSVNSDTGREIAREREPDVSSATTSLDHHSTPRPRTSEPPRFELKDPTPTPTGQVDGAWWPRSHHLARELPSLIPTLVDRFGPVERVGYHLGDWDETPRRIAVDGVAVATGGYHHQRTCTIDILTRKHRLTLLVVPVDEAPEHARAAMAAAARPGNTDTVADLLSTTAS